MWCRARASPQAGWALANTTWNPTKPWKERFKWDGKTKCIRTRPGFVLPSEPWKKKHDRTWLGTCAASTTTGEKREDVQGEGTDAFQTVRENEDGSHATDPKPKGVRNGRKTDAGVELEPLPTSDQSDTLLKIRHTSAHVMAMAVQQIFKDAQVTIGPWIDNGFYYDFDLKTPLSEKDLKKIKKKMRYIINKNLPLVREEVTREEAEKRIKALGEPYKLEILQGIQEEPITIYHIGNEWWDLCAGPHLDTTGQIDAKALELESVAGAYWRGDEKREMLQRIYGTAWETEEQLQQYLVMKEEAKKRDHRKLGKELDLFSIQEDAGGGLVFWHPKGGMVRHIIESFWKETHLSSGYELLYSPHVAKLELWKTSGHFDFYKENMFDSMDVEDETYQLKPMNCPFHIVVYQDGYRSYRDLPLRWAELGTVYRYERSGTMHGLFRVRGFTQDDAHIFCLPDQITDEICGVLDLVEQILTTFGFKTYEINLSTKPDKAVGGDDIWTMAEESLVAALERKNWSYKLDQGGGAFYGPKIDVKITDAIGRQWQCSTIQLDFNLPERFNLEYVTPENGRARPIMIHRAIFGSIERFFGILVESYAGMFPLWLAPIQAQILPVSDSQLDYCNKVASKMRAQGLRVEVKSGERLAKLIRNAEVQKIPVLLVAGQHEAENNGLSVRTRADGDLGELSVDEVVVRMNEKVHIKCSECKLS